MNWPWFILAVVCWLSGFVAGCYFGHLKGWAKGFWAGRAVDEEREMEKVRAIGEAFKRMDE